MRTLLAILLIASTKLVPAQEWALLNPAYRYNYSNDGTDTISNQIRVMGMDTLGVDSIRYTLNLIGVVCDTCPAILGGPCNGCFVWVDQPQFLGYDCIRVGNDWHFNGRDTFLLRTNGEVGETWPLDPAGTTMATVDAEWEQELLGVNDTLRRILLSSGDTLLLSRSFGIVRFPGMSGNYQLIGVEGAGIGRSLPDPLSFFDYNSGDELTYKIVNTYTASPPGGPSFPQTQTYYWQAIFTGRENFPDSVRYTVSVARSAVSYGYSGGGGAASFWPMPPNPWVIDRTTLAQQHPVLSSFPMQLLDRSAVWSSTAYTGYLAEHGLTEDGRQIIRSAQLLANNDGINLYSSPIPGLHPFHTGYDASASVKVKYEEGLGLVTILRRRQSIIEYSVTLVGAIIDGDTIIPPPNINWTVGMEESSLGALMLYPNPADNSCFISGLIGGEKATVFDLEGRMVLTTQLTAERATMDVSGMAPGTYVVNVKGMRPQRLIIAR